jgi:6-phosphogluconolactonase
MKRLIVFLFLACAVAWPIDPGLRADLSAQGAKASASIGNGGYFIYIGTYTEKTSKGIYAYRFTPSTGALTPLGLVGETPNAAFLAATPDGRFLYAVNWNSCAACGSRPPKNAPPPSVSAFAVDGKTGKLTFLNKVDPKGDMPTNLVVDHTGKTVLSVQYDGGNIVAFPIQPDGRLGEATYNEKHVGVGVHAVPGPHAHGVLISPDNQYAFVAELGLDRIYSYRLDAASAKLTPLDPPYIQHGPNTGPRHLAMHPSGRWLYSNKEQVPEVTSYQVTNGTLKELQTVSPVPADYKDRNSTAEIQIDKAGKFVYVSNRGHNSIAVFSVDQATGKLTPVQWAPTGNNPRSFSLDQTGEYLFVANQGADNVAVYRVDPSTGKLTATGEKLPLSTPVTVTFVKAQ